MKNKKLILNFYFRIIMESGILEKLLPFLNHGSALRRAGVITTIKNCSFELGKF